MAKRDLTADYYYTDKEQEYGGITAIYFKAYGSYSFCSLV